MDGKMALAAKKYGFTPKEIVVFNHFIKGHNASEIALIEGLTYETTRWYIKQIYQKTGVKRQTMLMALLLE
jgi:DNA-binding CsgD family transcriptional regulator